MNYIILSEKKWNSNLCYKLSKEYTNHSFVFINNIDSFNLGKIKQLNPHKIFIPHWSSIIDKQIYEKYDCVVFHMTDLPYGRGGSPLQNLIARGHSKTKISAIRIDRGIDTGDIYLKKELLLCGTAEEIFIDANHIIEGMIKEIIDKDIEPIPQEGPVVEFTRRKPKDSSISELTTLKEVFDYIRMLDAEGYPNAFVEIGNFRFEFNRASLRADNKIIADVRITEK